MGEAAGLDLLCPNCDYNLQGLPEPRCPECGRAFEWSELSAEHRWRRGIFEFAPSVRNYLRTQRRMLSRTFPGHMLVIPALRPKVFAVFCLLGILLAAMAMFLPALAVAARENYDQGLRRRQAWTIYQVNGLPKPPEVVAMEKQRLELLWPSPDDVRFWELSWGEVALCEIHVPLLLLVLLQISAVSFGLLMKDSLQRASRTKARAAEIILYAADLFVVAAVVVLCIGFVYLQGMILGSHPIRVDEVGRAVWVGSGIGAVILLVRLVVVGQAVYGHLGMGLLLAVMTCLAIPIAPLLLLLILCNGLVSWVTSRSRPAARST